MDPLEFQFPPPDNRFIVGLKHLSSPRDHAPGLTAIAGLRNLGPKSAEWLRATGVTTRDELARLGAIECCRRLRRAGFPLTLNMAYGIEAALMDCDWRRLPPAFRQQLQIDFEKPRPEENARTLTPVSRTPTGRDRRLEDQ